MEGNSNAAYRTVPEVARQMRCGTRPVYRAIKAGKLRAVAINDRGDLRVADSWVGDWIERLSERQA